MTAYFRDASVRSARIRISLRSRLHYTEEISRKRRFHSEKVSIKCSLSTLLLRNPKTQPSQVILDLCLRKTLSGKSREYRHVVVFEELGFQNVFCPHEIAKPAFSNSSVRFEEGILVRKAPFSRRISVDGRPNRRNKAAFSNYVGVQLLKGCKIVRQLVDNVVDLGFVRKDFFLGGGGGGGGEVGLISEGLIARKNFASDNVRIHVIKGLSV